MPRVRGRGPRLGRRFGQGAPAVRDPTGSAGLAYSPDGRRLAEIGGAGHSHRLRDAGSGKEVLELTSDPSAGIPSAIAFSPDGSRLAVSSEDSKVRIWDVDGRERRRSAAPPRASWKERPPSRPRWPGVPMAGGSSRPSTAARS